jgi:hypothetical protein
MTMTDETKKPDEIDQAALDAHPEEQQGNDAGGASSDEQSTGDSAAPVADGASAEGNVVSAAPSATDGSATATSSDVASSTPTTTATTDTVAPSGDAGNAAGAATDGALADGDAPVDGGEAGNVDAAVSTSQTATAAPDVGYVQQEASASADTSDAQAVPATDASVSSSDTATEPEPLPLGAGGVIVPVADSTPEDQAQLAAADKVGATVEDDSGNVVAGGAPAVVTSSPASDTPTIDPNSDEHPLKTRARWLRLKFEAEEAVVMEHIVDLLRDIEAEF